MSFKRVIKMVFKNPISIWFSWLLKTGVLYWTNRRKSITIGYLTKVRSSTLGKYVALKENIVISNSNIDDFTYISKGSRIRHTTIGKFCSIGQEVICGLGQHPMDFLSTHPIFYSKNSQIDFRLIDKSLIPEYEKIEVGNDVWIGSRVLIMDGVKIGNGAVIGAGSIVTKDIPDYCVAVGIPAKVIKTRLNESVIRKNYGWWQNDTNWLRQNLEIFQEKNV